ncbi:ABC transporter ATP-binding protein [Shewanella corallii]|uniref:ABC transporter ATP-binding protein n=1 Tax=Shewanella corallii TaxID=560080 RepID=A0ABT0N835_9GAMM|nr:ABC transporter ATP-binding protein [Shewanella corallii]
MDTPVIRASGLGKTYSHRGSEAHTALTDVSFELGAGRLLALLGHNGAGKSTLIKLVLGLIEPSQGEISVMGQNPVHSRGKRALPIGYLPENVSFYDNMTGFELLKYFAALKGIGAQSVKQLLEEFGLDYAMDRKVRTYSKGMRQRLGLAQATLAEPKVLLLDEPTVGLDPLASAFLYRKLNELKQAGCAVIVCTHELGLVEQELDKALILGKGRVLAKGDMSVLRQGCDLQLRVAFDDLPKRVAGDAFLSEFVREDALVMNFSRREQVLDYLIREKQICDLSVSLPSLSDIFHHHVSPLVHSATCSGGIEL